MRLRFPLIFVLAVVLFILAVPPSADAQSSAILQWAQVDKPGRKGLVVVHPSDVMDFAVGRSILYATDNETDPTDHVLNYRALKSENSGLTWIDITRNLLNAGALLPTRIACSPDGQVVAAITDTGTKVYLSIDYGTNWNNTDIPGLAETIQCIAISGSYAIPSGATLITVWDVAIGTAVWGNAATEGQVWTFQVGGTISTWRNQNITVDPAVNFAEVSAIAFSPHYADDGTLLAVSSNNTSTYLCAGRRDLSAQTTEWNNNLPNRRFPNYPVPIGSLSGDNVTTTTIVSSIALSSGYTGTDSSRKVLVSCYKQLGAIIDNNSDAYRLDDVNNMPYQQFRLNVNGGLGIAIRNIAYSGASSRASGWVASESGTVIAGDVNPETPFTTQVRRLSNPFPDPTTSPPTWSWQTATQPPTGPGNAKVAWSSDGTKAFCGTSRAPSYIPPLPEPPPYPDESAFSQSLDGGDTWLQTSLMDTIIRISDIAPAPDSKSFFLASFTGLGPESVWRTAGEPLGDFWGRLFTINTISNRLILRLSPNYDKDYTIYVAEVGDGVTGLIAVSHDRGNTWQKRYIPGSLINGSVTVRSVIDMAVENKDTVYIALAGGYIRKSIDSAYSWLVRTAAGFSDNISMLSVAGAGNLLVGSRNGKVAYSTDGGLSFVEIDKPVSYNISDNTGNVLVISDVQVIADANYSQNKIIYAADNISDHGIWRWSIGTSTDWKQIDAMVTALSNNQTICGLGMGKEGTLYALRADHVTTDDTTTDNVTSNGKGGGMTRAPNPSQPYNSLVEFDVVNRTLPFLPPLMLSPEPTAFDPNLIFSHTMPSLKLASGNMIWAIDFANMLIYRFEDNICKAGPVTSSLDYIGCDPVSGRNQEINFTWEQLSLANGYDIEISKDEIFSMTMFNWVDSSTDNITLFYHPPLLTKPAFIFPVDAIASPFDVPPPLLVSQLECGHTYYWRVQVRSSATGEVIRSPWSTVRRFTLKAGLPVITPYYGLQLLSPDNGYLDCPVEPACFSWSPYKETTKYEFVLAEDAAMTQIIDEWDSVPTTAFQYDGTLEYNKNYFWRVRARQPAPSDWSATFSFRTKPAPAPPIPPSKAPATQPWVWGIITMGTVLIAGLLILILLRR